jgi:hypothetical protein
VTKKVALSAIETHGRIEGIVGVAGAPACVAVAIRERYVTQMEEECVAAFESMPQAGDEVDNLHPAAPALPPVVKAEPGAANGAVKKEEPEDGTADWKPPKKQLKAADAKSRRMQVADAIRAADNPKLEKAAMKDEVGEGVPAVKKEAGAKRKSRK